MTARVTIFHTLLSRLVREETLARRKRIADQIAADARATAPVLTGQFRGGIDVHVSGTLVQVVDTDETSIHKEYGTSDTPAHAVLTNAAMPYGKYRGMRPRRSRL